MKIEHYTTFERWRLCESVSECVCVCARERYESYDGIFSEKPKKIFSRMHKLSMRVYMNFIRMCTDRNERLFMQCIKLNTQLSEIQEDSCYISSTAYLCLMSNTIGIVCLEWFVGSKTPINRFIPVNSKFQIEKRYLRYISGSVSIKQILISVLTLFSTFRWVNKLCLM